MNTTHLSEQQLQDYAERPAADAQLAAHVQTCAKCEQRVAEYRELFAALALVPQPGWEINLAARVLKHLPAPASRPAFPWELAGAGLLLLGFAAAILFVGWPALQPIFASVTPATATLLFVLMASVVLGYGLELGGRHRQQLRQLPV